MKTDLFQYCGNCSVFQICWPTECSTLTATSLQFSHSVQSDSLQPHELQRVKPPYPSPAPGVYPNSCALRWLCHQTISLSVIKYSSWPQSSLASESFQMSYLFTSGDQIIGVLTPTWVLPVNTQDRSPLRWTGWISLQSKGLSRVFSNITVQKHQSLAPSFLYSPILTTIQDYWKTQNVDYADLCWQSNVSAF